MSSASSSSSLSSSGQVGTTSVGGGGDGILVDLLETEVDSLKAQLEKTQNDLVSFFSINSMLVLLSKISLRLKFFYNFIEILFEGNRNSG